MDGTRPHGAANGSAPGSEPNYDRLPYPSLPIAYSQPASLAAMAIMFGAAPPDAANARVLELGCASGGNLIPMAARFPQGRFVGIDLSQRQVDDANQRIAKLGLSNVMIGQGDLTHASFAREAFDFIICHGVFSWVQRAAQDAILRICSESLAPQGVASISYNVLPGWHMRRIVRDICLFHAGATGSPNERVARARKGLNEIAGALGGQSPYATLLRGEAQRLAKQPAAYVLGEFLAEENAPCYFGEFAARAAANGLTYLCDGEVATSLPEYFFPAAATRIRAMSRENATALQQYTDLFSGRPFRRSLLVRTAQAQAAIQAIDPQRLRTLHFAAELRRKHAFDGSGGAVFLDAKGRSVKAQGPASTAMLERLATAYPSTQTLDDLLDNNAGDPAVERNALNALLQLMGSEQATASTLPLKVDRGEGAKPRAWAVARLEASAGQPWATGQHHQPVKLSPALALLLRHMDGASDRAALRAAAEEILARDPKLAATADDVLAKSLAYAARHGMLER